MPTPSTSMMILARTMRPAAKDARRAATLPGPIAPRVITLPARVASSDRRGHAAPEGAQRVGRAPEALLSRVSHLTKGRASVHKPLPAAWPAATQRAASPHLLRLDRLQEGFVSVPVLVLVFRVVDQASEE